MTFFNSCFLQRGIASFRLVVIAITFGIPLCLSGQHIQPSDSLIIAGFLKDLETEGCPPIVQPLKPLKDWYGLSYTADNTGKVTVLSIGFDLIFKSIACKVIPASVATLAQLPGLIDLKINNLGIEHLPTEIGKLHQLVNIDLSYNKLAALPDEFGDMPTLRSVTLSHNRFTAFSPALLKLDQVKRIDLSYNEIAGTIPEAIWPTGDNRDVYLDFSYNQMSGEVRMPPAPELIKMLNIQGNHFLIHNLSLLRMNWPSDSHGFIRTLLTGGQSTNSKTVSPVPGNAVALEIENYIPEGQVKGWWKQDPATGFSSKVSEKTIYTIDSFDPEQHAGKYNAIIFKSIGTQISYGPVLIRGNTKVPPTLAVSDVSIHARLQRKLKPVIFSFQDDFTAVNDLTVDIETVPINLIVTSSLLQPGQYRLLVEAKNNSWAGDESFTLRVTDEDGNVTLQVITVSVVNEANISPVVHTIPEVFAMTDSSGISPKIYYSLVNVTLKPYVTDDYDSVEDMEIILHPEDIKRLQGRGIAAVSGQGAIMLYDDGGQTRPVFEESLRFTIVDRDGGIGEGSIPLRYPLLANRYPEITPVADRYLVKGSLQPLIISLDNYITDDLNRNEDLQVDPVFKAPENYKVAIKNHLLEITSLATATEVLDSVMLTIYEPNSFMTAQLKVRLKVQAGTAPLISRIPNQVIVAGNSFTPITLNAIVYDESTSAEMIQWEFKGQQYLRIDVINGILQVSVIDPAWRGSEKIQFIVTDQEGKTDQREVTFTVFNYPPSVKIKPQHIAKGYSFTPVDLYTSVEDDTTLPQDIMWHIDTRDAPDLLVVQQGHTVTITPRDLNWRGRNYVIFQATDSQGKVSNSYVEFSIDFEAPVVKPIPPVVRTLGTTLVSIDLNDYITDDVTPVNKHGIQIINNPPHLYPELDYYAPLNLYTLSVVPDPGWTGTDEVLLKVIDTDFLETTFSVKITILDNSYTLSGTIKDQHGSMLPNVLLEGFTEEVKTDAAGKYTAKEPVGRSFTIVPHLTGHSFQPASLTVANLTEDRIIDFTGKYTVSPAPTISPSGSLQFCQGDSVTLTAPAGFAGYLWSNGATTSSIKIKQTGTYTLQVKQEHTDFSEASVPVTIQVNSLPNTPAITASRPLIFCQGDSVVLSAPEDMSSYLWSTGATSATITVKQSGSYSVRVRNANGCESFASPEVKVQVDPLPNRPTIIPPASLSFCQGDSVKLWGPGGFFGYRWSTGATATHIWVKQTGSYTLQVLSAAGCISPASLPVSLQAIALPNTPTITASRPLSFCQGDSVVLSAPEGMSSYLWSTGATGPTLSVKQSGSYWVKGKTHTACESLASPSVLVTVHALPSLPIIVFQGMDTLLVSASAKHFHWERDGQPIVEDAAKIKVTQTGSYRVRLENEAGCQSAYSSGYSFVVTGLESMADLDWVVYPNPAQTQLFVQTPSRYLVSEVRLYNPLGHICRQLTAWSATTPLSLVGLSAGMYVVEIRMGATLIRKKVAIQP